jgi:hypothetical protein
MIAQRTVLILGAGSSNHCGYPLGSELVQNICRLRDAEGIQDIQKYWGKDVVREFIERLSYSDPSSIDSFLEREGPEHRELGKHLIAHQLKGLEVLDKLFPPNTSGWYKYAFDAVFSDGQPALAQGNLGVLTFNYDRSFEAYFHKRLSAQFGLDSGEVTRAMTLLPIVHLHGSLGAYPDVPYISTATFEELQAISRNISIIHDITDSEDGFSNPAFKIANEMLMNAERVLVLGFGWHSESIRRFKFFTPANCGSRIIKGTAAGFGPIAMRRLHGQLAEYGIKSDGVRNWSCLELFSYEESL